MCVVFWGIFRNRLVGKIRIHFVCFLQVGVIEQPFWWMSLGLKPSDLVQSYIAIGVVLQDEPWSKPMVIDPTCFQCLEFASSCSKCVWCSEQGHLTERELPVHFAPGSFLYKLMALENKRARERMTMNDVMCVPDFFQKDQSTSIARQQSTIPKSTCFLQSFVSGSSEPWSFNLW